MRTYTFASPAAILAGAAATVLSIALLLRDVRDPWSVDAALPPVLVLVTIIAGHNVWRALRRGRLISATLLALLTVFGSSLVVWEQMGRRAEARDTKVASAEDNSVQRQRLQKKLTEAEEVLGTHRASRDRECATGKGKQCDGKQYTVATWEAAVTGYKAELTGLGTPKPVDPKAERLAALSNMIGFGAEDAKVRSLVAMFDPLAVPLFLELGAIILFGYGLSPVPRRRSATMETVATVTHLSAEDSPETSPPGGGMTKIAAERDLITLLALKKPIESQDHLADRWRVGKGTVSKWMSEWEDRGIVTRSIEGRRKLIVAA